MFVFGPGGKMQKGVYGGALAGKKGLFLWDKRVTERDAKILIARADAQFLERGWIDYQTGARLRREDLVSKERAQPSADHLFTDRGAVLLVPPGKSAAEMRIEFSDPEKVAVVPTPLGGQVLCHARDRVRVKRRQELAMQALRDLGYDNLADLPTDIKDILTLREKVFKRIAEIESAQAGNS
jgi:hypothetical protein